MRIPSAVLPSPEDNLIRQEPFPANPRNLITSLGCPIRVAHPETYSRNKYWNVLMVGGARLLRDRVMVFESVHIDGY